MTPETLFASTSNGSERSPSALSTTYTASLEERLRTLVHQLNTRPLHVGHCPTCSSYQHDVSKITSFARRDRRAETSVGKSRRSITRVDPSVIPSKMRCAVLMKAGKAVGSPRYLRTAKWGWRASGRTEEEGRREGRKGRGTRSWLTVKETGIPDLGGAYHTPVRLDVYWQKTFQPPISPSHIPRYRPRSLNKQ